MVYGIPIFISILFIIIIAVAHQLLIRQKKSSKANCKKG